MTYTQKFVLGSICAAASLVCAAALAQQQGQQAAPVPMPEQRSQQQQQQSIPDPDFRGLWSDRGTAGRSQSRSRGERPPEFSESDRNAFFEARLASIKAGLMLTEAQQALWPPVENAVREMAAQRQVSSQRMSREDGPNDFASRMKRAGETMSARGAAMIKFADAIKPFHESLTDDQKRRLAMLMRPQSMHGGDVSRHRDRYRSGMEMRGQHHQRWNRDDRNWGEQRWGRRGENDREERGSRRWRQNNSDDDSSEPRRGRM